MPTRREVKAFTSMGLAQCACVTPYRRLIVELVR